MHLRDDSQTMEQLRAYTEKANATIQDLSKRIEPLMKKLGEIAQLMGIRLLTAARNFPDHVRVIARYYPDWKFLRIDWSLLAAYAFRSPFTLSKRYLQQHGQQDVYQYGETPLPAIDQIATECGITAQDTVYELGSGRGRVCFWLNHFKGCKVVGIEYIPEFVRVANGVKHKYKLDKVTFIEGDFLKTDFKEATVIYLYGTCLEDKQIEQLIEKLSKLPSGTKIITVSYPLSDYTKKPLFEVMKRFPAHFTWGTGDVYLQYKK